MPKINKNIADDEFEVEMLDWPSELNSLSLKHLKVSIDDKSGNHLCMCYLTSGDLASLPLKIPKGEHMNRQKIIVDFK